jgi:hypothetical protein
MRKYLPAALLAFAIGVGSLHAEEVIVKVRPRGRRKRPRSHCDEMDVLFTTGWARSSGSPTETDAHWLVNTKKDARHLNASNLQRAITDLPLH